MSIYQTGPAQGKIIEFGLESDLSNGLIERASPIEALPPPLDPAYFGSRIDLGTYAAYELLSGAETEGKWSVALLEIYDSPKHFHRIEKEQFVVVRGILSIEIDGNHQRLEAGESVLIIPKQIHKLRSGTEEPVRVLCFSFPAFDPEDMYTEPFPRVGY